MQAGEHCTLLGSISDFCQRTGMAESTFGRRAVNDGKFVARLRDGARVTPETLQRVNAVHLEERRRRARATSPPELLPLIRASALAADARRRRSAAREDPETNFRFFDNRQKYLLFVNTCSEKEVVARRVGLELGHIHPRPPAVRLFDAGMGDGTVLARVMREMHRRFPTVPFYIVGKEISLEDVRLSAAQDGRPLLRASGDRAGGHQHVLHRGAVADAARRSQPQPRWCGTKRRSPAAPRTSSASRSPRSSRSWRRTGRRATARRPATRSTSIRWRWCSTATTTASCSTNVIPRAAQGRADYDMVIASQPYRAARAARVQGAEGGRRRWCARSARAGACSASIPTAAIRAWRSIQKVWPGENPYTQSRHDVLRAVKAELGKEARRYNFNAYARRARAVPLRHAHAAHRDLRRASAPRRCSPPGTRRSTSRRSTTQRLGEALRRAQLPRRDARGAAEARQPLVPGRVLCRLPQARLSCAASARIAELVDRRLAGDLAARAAPRRGGRGAAADRHLRLHPVAARPAAVAARWRWSPRCAPPASTRCRTSRRGASSTRRSSGIS